MTKLEALILIDNHKNKLLNPVEMLHWTWLRVIIAQLSDEAWNAGIEDATAILSQ